MAEFDAPSASELLQTSDMPASELQGVGQVVPYLAGRAAGAVKDFASGYAGNISSALKGQPTTAPTVAPENIDQGKFNTWYQNGALHYGLHPDPSHPDMNVNIHDMFARGGQFKMTPPGQPDVIAMPDGKTTPITPTNFPMTTTSEALDEQRKQQGITIPPATPPTGSAPAQPAATPIASALQPTVSVGAPAVAPAPVQAASVPATPVAAAMQGGITPTVGTEVAPPEQPHEGVTSFSDLFKGENLGKFQKMAGILASSINPKQFGPAGEMLVKSGDEQISRARADAAAVLAGYPNTAAMEAAKTAAGITKTGAETALERARVPYVQAETQKILKSFPGMDASTAQTQAQTEALKQQTYYKSLMPPRPMTVIDPVSGQPVTANVDGEHVFTTMINALNANTHFLGTMSTAGLQGAEGKLKAQELAYKGQLAPVNIGGHVYNLNVHDALAAYAASSHDSAVKAKYQAFDMLKQNIEEARKQTLPGKAPVFDQGIKDAAFKMNQEYSRSTDPAIQLMGQTVMLITGQIPTNTAPGGTPVSSALRGSTPAQGATTPSWLNPNLRPGGR